MIRRQTVAVWAMAAFNLLASGCGDRVGSAGEAAQVCSPQWFAFVESAVPTGDGQGHGPDPGSEEWRSTVEFRLGIRGLPEVPARMTRAWCRYIDARLPGK